MGKESESWNCCGKAIAEHPDAELCVNLGNLLSPRDAATWPFPSTAGPIGLRLNMRGVFNQGVAFQDQRMVTGGQGVSQRAVQLCPNGPSWRLRQLTAGPVRVPASSRRIEDHRQTAGDILDLMDRRPRPSRPLGTNWPGPTPSPT